MDAVRAGNVLRGMDVESAAVRIGRVCAAPRDLSVAARSLETDESLLRQRVEEEVARVRDQAERQGYEAGLCEGRRAADLQAASARKQAAAAADAALAAGRTSVDALLRSLAAAREELLRASEEDMVALCFEVLCRLLGELAPRPDTVRAQIRDAVDRLPEGEDLAIHVHPADADLLGTTAHAAAPRCRWVSDPAVELGGCIVKHAGGGLDMRLETALALCRDALVEQHRRRLPQGTRA